MVEEEEKEVERAPVKEDDDEDDIPYGPALPKDLEKKKPSIGPSLPLPPSISPKDDIQKKRSYGPTLPPVHDVTQENNNKEVEEESDSDDGFVGPAIPKDLGKPKDHEFEFQQRLLEIELRAQRDAAKEAQEEEEAKMKKQKNETLERGEWMLVPPSLDRGGVSSMSVKDVLKARTFSKGAAKSYSEEDQSAWTEVKGSSTKRKHDDNTSSRNVKPRNPIEDSKLKSLVSDYNSSNRAESLMDSYSKSSAAAQKMKQQQDDISSRPFDRDRDMGRPTVDAKKRKEIIDNAKELNTRFGHGSKSFL